MNYFLVGLLDIVHDPGSIDFQLFPCVYDILF